MTAYMVAIKPHVSVHEKPDVTSAVIASLRYEIVAPIGGGALWQEVEYRPGKAGYVLADNLQHPTGYSLDLAVLEGQWRIKWVASYCD